MGRNKLLLDLGGETVVRRAVRTALAAELDPVVVVTGHEREAVEAELHDLPCRPVYNDEHARGQHTSIRAGVAAVDRGRPAVDRGRPATADEGRPVTADEDCVTAIVLLADMPFVTPAMLRTVVARHADTHAPLVVSRYGGDTTAPPILYGRRLFPELLRMDRRCGRQVVKRHRAEAVVVDWPLRAMCDLDRPSDYADAQRELAGAGRAMAHG